MAFNLTNNSDTAVTQLSVEDNIPFNYKRYEALVSPSSATTPTVTTLYNNLGGDVTWARTASGITTATLSYSGFTAGRTILPQPIMVDNVTKRQYKLSATTTQVITLNTQNITTLSAITPIDCLTTDAPLFVEFRVY